MLGVPTAILAHTLLFGQSHQLGGSLHGLFFAGGVAACVIAALVVAILAVAGSRTTPTGSLLAFRLSSWLPGVVSLAGSTLFWYALIESAEKPHVAAAPMLLLIATVVLCALGLRTVARGVIAAIASVAISVRLAAFAVRSFSFVPAFPEAICAFAGRIAARRLFARPPPAAMQRA
jgi:hypothetical protein